MKDYELLDMIGEVNEDYVREADGNVVRPRFRWKTLAACAACAALALGAYPLLRLQELSLEYTLNRKYLKNVCDLTFGFVANNLWMIYCKAPFDPELAPSASSTFYTGVDNFMQPSLRNIGFNVKIQF